MVYTIIFKTRWADFDPNNHLRHTAYNDYAAESRVRFFNDNGFSLLEFNEFNIGPILFKEETDFYREIRLGEDITVEIRLKGISKNGDRFKFQHKIIKQDGVIAAVIEIYGAWMDLKTRKLTNPPKEILSTFDHLEKTVDFEIIEKKQK